MSEPRLDNTVRQAREDLHLSQQSLAERVGVSRQAIIAIESGRSVPSTALGLRLARALRTHVEDLFRLGEEAGIAARLAPRSEAGEPSTTPDGARVALGEVAGRWVAHRLPADATRAADGIIAAEPSERTAVVRPLGDVSELRRNVLVAGCAPLLGALSERVGALAPDARATWLAAGSGRALALLQSGLIHVAGVHFGGARPDDDNASLIRDALPGTKVLVANLTRWRLGLVVPAGNPLRLRSGADLLRPGLRFARREEGAGAQKLVARLVADEGVDRLMLPGPLALGHVEVAQLVRCGAADVGVAIEAVALAAGLGFVPLMEERFDLVVPADYATEAPVSRLLETLGDPAFRADAGGLPGYDSASCGHVTTLEAA